LIRVTIDHTGGFMVTQYWSRDGSPNFITKEYFSSGYMFRSITDRG
jgi:hypothetical protein